jgi:hypothetical protein
MLARLFLSFDSSRSRFILCAFGEEAQYGISRMHRPAEGTPSN